jgi:hypothetical protein
VINSYFESVEKIIQNNSLIVCANLYKNHTSLNTAYIKGEITFADGSRLAVFQHVRIHETELLITDYRYHYMTNDNQLIFRYDNAPHHVEITTFPHHKHLPSCVQHTDIPNLKDILEEIDLTVIKKFI